MDFGMLVDLGITGMLVVAVIMLIDFIRKRFREGNKGDRRMFPRVIECPNKIEGLAATLVSLDKQIGRLVDHHEEYPPNAVVDAVKGVARVEIGVARLLEETRPGSRAQMIREESRDLLRELVAVVKKNGFHN